MYKCEKHVKNYKKEIIWKNIYNFQKECGKDVQIYREIGNNIDRSKGKHGTNFLL